MKNGAPRHASRIGRWLRYSGCVNSYDPVFSRPVRDFAGFGMDNPILKNGAIEQLSLAGQEERLRRHCGTEIWDFEIGEGWSGRASGNVRFGRDGKDGN